MTNNHLFVEIKYQCNQQSLWTSTAKPLDYLSRIMNGYTYCGCSNEGRTRSFLFSNADLGDRFLRRIKRLYPALTVSSALKTGCIQNTDIPEFVPFHQIQFAPSPSNLAQPQQDPIQETQAFSTPAPPWNTLWQGLRNRVLSFTKRISHYIGKVTTQTNPSNL